MKKMWLIALLFLVMLYAAPMIGTISADDDDGDDLYYVGEDIVTIEKADVDGNIYIYNCSNVNITNSYIDGNIEIENNQGYLKINHTYIDGNLIISWSKHGEVFNNEINGNIEAHHNEYVAVKNNIVKGNLIFTDNTALDVTGNTVYGDIEYKYETEERELDIEVSDSLAEIESEFENEEMENEFEIDFSTGEGIVLDLEYSSEVNATEYELELEVGFLRLVEFSKGESVQTIDLTELEYSSPTVTQITSADGEAGYKLESHLVGQTFVFQIIVYIFPKYAVIDDTPLNPTEMKITIVIEDFPYQEDDGALALLIKATSEMEMERESMNDEEDIEIKSDTATGYFSWSNEASVDDAPRPVNSTVTKTDEGSLIALNYPHGTEIVHDPKLGVSILLAVAEFPWLYIIAGAVIIALVVAVAIRMSRPRIQNSMSA